MRLDRLGLGVVGAAARALRTRYAGRGTPGAGLRHVDTITVTLTWIILARRKALRDFRLDQMPNDALYK
jgi:hypothetical protein